MIGFSKQQDKIAFIAPASTEKDEHGNMDKAQSFERLHRTINFFEERGFRCEYNKNIFLGDDLEYFAAPKAERLKHLRDAIENPEIRVIYAFRGGYGCADIAFDCLDVIPSGPKIMIGFSDITILHLLFNQNYKFHSIHGSMDAKNIKMLEEVVDVISGNNAKINLHPIVNINQKQEITGEVVGGNLAVLCSVIGTDLQPLTKDKILFIEDVDESGYQIHRYLVQMYRAGLFDRVKCLIFGEFISKSQDIELSIKSFINEYLLKIPVYKTNEIGHGEINRPVIIGSIGKITDNCLNMPSPFKVVS